MRILHVISNMRPESGGPQEAVRMMLHSAPTGTISEVATLDDPYASYLRDDPRTIHAMGTRRRLTDWLRTHRSHFDGIVVHGLWEPLHLSILAAIAGHTPYVVYPHGMLDPYFKRTFPLKHAKKWMYWLAVQYWVLRRAHRVVFTTETERDHAAKSFWLHRWDPAVIALGAEQPPANIEACKEAFYRRCPAVKGKRYLLFLGRIDPKKGCDLLINAFANTKSLDDSLHLVMAGPDTSDWRDALDAAANRFGLADRIHWPDMLTGLAKWGALYACDAFVLPSHQENFGIAIVEALSCGKPALLTHPINIASDLAADDSALVEDDTLDGVQKLIVRWLALTPEQRATMGKNALTTVATRYDMRKNTQSLFELFNETHSA